MVWDLTLLFESTFAMLSNTVLYSPMEGLGYKVSANILKTTQKLFIFLPVAYTICIVVLLSVVGSVATLIYSSRHPSILHEEPSGLLSYADILFGSNIDDVVKRIRGRPEYDGRVRKTTEGASLLDDLHYHVQSSPTGLLITARDL